MTAYDVTLGPEKPFSDGHTATGCYRLEDARQWADNLLSASIIDYHSPLRMWIAEESFSGGPPRIRCISEIHRELEERN